MKFQLKDVVPNPFRNMEYYPIFRPLVEHLKESIATTEFWENIVGRENKEGKLEIAYGHHRLVALKELYPETQEFDFRVKPLTDAAMLQIMARENMEDYSTDVCSVLEAVRATVKALADGLISESEMPAPEPKTNEQYIRYAPSFVAGKGIRAELRAHPYTAATIGRFLGMTQKQGRGEEVRATDHLSLALAALELHEEGYFNDLMTSRGSFDNLENNVNNAARAKRIDLAERAAKAAKEREDEERRKAEEETRAAREAKQAEEEAAAAEAEAKRKAEEAERKRLEAERKAQAKKDEETKEALRKAEREKEAAEKAAKAEQERKEKAEALRKRLAKQETEQRERAKRAEAYRKEQEKKAKEAREEERKKKATEKAVLIRAKRMLTAGFKMMEEEFGHGDDTNERSRAVLQAGLTFEERRLSRDN